MPVTFDASTKALGTQTNTISLVCSLTIASNACLIVGCYFNGTANKSISAVIANGTTLTQLGRFEAANGNIITFHGLENAPSGVVSISANMVGGATFFDLYAASYVGAKTTGAFGNVQGGSANAANIALSLSTSTTDFVVWGTCGGDIFSATNSTTRQFNSSHFGSFLADTAGPASSISLSATVAAAAAVAFLGVNIIFSAAGASTVPLGLATMGCGV